MGKNDLYWSWSYVDQRLGGALRILTTSFAPNAERMEAALSHVLLLLPSHFPDQDLFDRLQRIIDAATAHGSLMLNDRIWRGSLLNTLKRRRRSTLERYARELDAIYREVLERQGSYSE